MLDVRLQACFDLVGGEGIVCDVGTDHALLAAELIRSGKCERVVASDIKEGPLDSARRTVEKYDIADKVELVLSDGLAEVPLEGVSDVVIAGMGGETIADIIAAAIEKASENVRWVLQPMTKAEILRKRLYELGLEIVAENLVEDGDKLYTVIAAETSLTDSRLTEFETMYGFFDDEQLLTRKYRQRESERLIKIAESLEKSGKVSESVHYRALGRKMSDGADNVSVQAVVDFLDSVYPFASQEKWDNSGLLVENSYMECSTVLLSLDISGTAISEAADKCADLIISHHPVIFEPRRRITRSDPVFKLISEDIAAVCMHTNVDKSPFGTNGVILRRLRGCFELTDGVEELADGFGYIVELADEEKVGEVAEKVKAVFGCEVVRMSREAAVSPDRSVRKIAFCSGSGGSMLDDAISKNCELYITGDVKHDVWIEAENQGIMLLDCGHFHTENLVLEEIRYLLEKEFPQLDVEIAESSTDPCAYL
ncbi:MAG: Nif3-like dinuclear metal center hexameric protein [Ruminococcus sp.]|nr:Nif3-like dinuclear metal center hexameric protein [Ruminococcus sp.]